MKGSLRTPAGAAQVREYHGQLSDDDEAIACHQEMKARVAESGAMLVLAEAESHA